jgi:hypothetical protein
LAGKWALITGRGCTAQPQRLAGLVPMYYCFEISFVLLTSWCLVSK